MKIKILSLVLIAIVAISSISAVSAAKDLRVDGDGRVIHQYKLTDQTTGELLYSGDVAAGDGHDGDISETHKFHQLLLTLTYGGAYPHPGYHALLINVWDGSKIDIYGEISYNWKMYYDSKLQYTVGSIKGSTKSSATI
ncbi:MAG: hypothetical protein LBT10_09645 [Methanobrevibacter sp.]|jgi:hypothetical protein|nr:hypothetical protein [Methanobrevibacter sp.]